MAELRFHITQIESSNLQQVTNVRNCSSEQSIMTFLFWPSPKLMNWYTIYMCTCIFVLAYNTRVATFSKTSPFARYRTFIAPHYGPSFFDWRKYARKMVCLPFIVVYCQWFVISVASNSSYVENLSALNILLLLRIHVCEAVAVELHWVSARQLVQV